MSFDGIFTHLMVSELEEKLLYGRIAKIQQPYDNEVVFTIRSHGKNHKLLLSAHPSFARIQITDMKFTNPSNPPTFTMMLRKHLEGSQLRSIWQIENDRIVHFHFAKRNELGDTEGLQLIVEIMGRHSTIVLMNEETGMILDCIRHIGPQQNTYRTLLPGTTYLAPPKQDRLDPYQLAPPAVFQLLQTAKTLDASFLQQHLEGLGRDTAIELAARLNDHPNDLVKTWETFFTALSDPEPNLATNEKKDFFVPIAFETLKTLQTYPTLSELLDAYYAEKAEKDRTKQLSGNLLHHISNEKKKNEKKLIKLEKTLDASENAEEFRRNGELLTTFLAQVPRGAAKVTLANYYDNDAPLDIPLRPDLSPSQNAQSYFKKYRKAKNGVHIVERQIRETKREIAYLESVEDQLNIASPADIQGIKEELTVSGYLKKQKKKNRNQAKSKPLEFHATDGTLIKVGRNNLQNDQLTLKTAKKNDFWLHVKNIPGSHVIIFSDKPSEETLLEAAQLAAYFSKYRFSSNVPVDYVQAKFVHKPNGAKPGFVIYENQKTLYVTPTETLVERLAVK